MAKGYQRQKKDSIPLKSVYENTIPYEDHTLSLGDSHKAQCSKIGKKVQHQKNKNTFFAISKMAKKNLIFAPE